MNAYPLINCGHETRILPRFLDLIQLLGRCWEDAGISKDELDTVSREFILKILLSQGKIISPYFCTKDPENLKYTSYLAKLFPKSKFILMIRDGRATVHSLVRNNFFGKNYKKNIQTLAQFTSFNVSRM